MNRERVAWLSFRREVADLMRDMNVWQRPFNVYTDTDLENEVVPSRPYVYILEPFVKVEAKLPSIVIEILSRGTVYQLGRYSLHCMVNVHVFAEGHAQRSDILGAVIENITSVRLRNFADDEDGEEIMQTSSLRPMEDGMLWSQSFMAPSSGEVLEGSKASWTMASCQFIYV